MSTIGIVVSIYLSVCFIGLFIAGLNSEQEEICGNTYSDITIGEVLAILAWPIFLTVKTPMWLGERIRKHIDEKKKTNISEK